MKKTFFAVIRGTVPAILFTALIASASLVNLSCDDDTSQNDVNSIVFPETNVKYGAHVQPLFDRACAFSGCHGPDTYLEHNGFSLESYQSLMNRVDIVAPGNPDNSMLIFSVEATNGFEGNRRMPWNRPALNDNQLRGLRRWVAEGAQNN